jgi:hypothetical protein
MTRKPLHRRFARNESGSATLEFVIMVPIVLTLLFSAIDFGVVMIRQVYLDRAVDMAAREIRLGQNVGTPAQFRQRICDRTIMVRECTQNLAVELRPINTASWAGLNAPAQCVNRDAEIAPVLEFNPGMGAQELMLIRACLVAEPFIRLTGVIIGMPLDPSGRYAVVARTAWVNEPR